MLTTSPLLVLNRELVPFGTYASQWELTKYQTSSWHAVVSLLLPHVTVHVKAEARWNYALLGWHAMQETVNQAYSWLCRHTK